MAAALVKAYSRKDLEVTTSGINSLKIASEAVRLTDAILDRLDETWEERDQ